MYLLSAGSLPKPCGYISRAYPPTVTGAQGPRRQSSQASQRPSMPIVCMHGVCSRYLLRRRFSPPMLTDPLVAAPSSPSLCRWSARAAPEANGSLRTVKSNTEFEVNCCERAITALAAYVDLNLLLPGQTFQGPLTLWGYKRFLPLQAVRRKDLCGRDMRKGGKIILINFHLFSILLLKSLDQIGAQ